MENILRQRRFYGRTPSIWAVNMSDTSSNRRRAHRHNARDLGYRATIIADSESIDCQVLDFSAGGLLLQTSVPFPVPSQGKLIYRDQSYEYQVRHEVRGPQSTLLGIETSAIAVKPTTRVAASQMKHLSRRLGGDTEKSIFDSTSWSLVMCICICLGVVIGSGYLTKDRKSEIELAAWVKSTKQSFLSSKEQKELARDQIDQVTEAEPSEIASSPTVSVTDQLTGFRKKR